MILVLNLIPLGIAHSESAIWDDPCLNKSICAMVKSRYIGDGHPTFY